MRELMTFNCPENFNNFIKEIKIKPTCRICGVKITYKNLGILAKNYYSCKDKHCLKIVLTEIALYDEQRNTAKPLNKKVRSNE